MARTTKLMREHPGLHVARATFWTPDGSSVGFEGAVQQSLYEFSVWALVHQLSPGELADLQALTNRIEERVTRKSREAESLARKNGGERD